MDIFIVGNVLKDVYLNLDSRTENFETDKNHTPWLNIGFNSSSHYFFHRASNYGGSAISMEVFTNFGLSSIITNSNFNPQNTSSTNSEESSTDANNQTPNVHPESYRYILTSDNGVSYLCPSIDIPTVFTAPEQEPKYIYIDRSASLNDNSINQILQYLSEHPSTRLVTYISPKSKDALLPLVAKSSLIFSENNTQTPPKSTIRISTNEFSYQNISEKITVDRIDTITHLSVYSIASATILASFIKGNTVEQSLRLARLNVENSTLTSTLSLPELSNLSSSNNIEDLELISATLLRPKKGILAADESGGSIQKKFAQLNIPDNFENRHTYRNIFFTTPNLEDYINGVILFDETARDRMDTGESIPDYLISRRIIPGIKVDQGLEKFENSEETYTKGLDGLQNRLREYYQMGLRFAKWRSAFTFPVSDMAITENCRILAEYAKQCQSAGLVPIVEPELVYDGDYSLEDSINTTSKILDTLFKTLEDFGINLRACILKVNMVLAGKKYKIQSTPEEVGKATAEVLKSHVPESLSGVVFLSGGQTPEQATANLSEVIKNGPFPWPVTFSFARALQDPALFTWKGDNSNLESAKQAFKKRLEDNSQALKA